jgi:uncharacterized membrane protein
MARMAVIFGLLAAVLWGLGDFLARFGGRAVGAWRTLFFIGWVGLLLLTLWLLAGGRLHAVLTAEARIWAVGAVAGIFHFIGSYALTRALTIGVVSIVTPLATSYGAITTALSLASGEPISSMALAGVAVTAVGVALASAVHPTQGGDARKGISWALAASLTFGLAFWAQGKVLVPAVGSLESVWIFLVVLVAIMAVARVAGYGSVAPPRGLTALTMLACAVASVGAAVTIALGFETGKVAIVAVLSSVSGFVAAALGAAFLGERLLLRQGLGVVLLTAGVAVIRASS